jgi:hypothetical protein
LRTLLLITITLFVGIGSVVGSSISGSSVAGASAARYTPCQEASIESLKIGFHLGQMYALAQQGHNISGFNAEVDRYNAWVQKNFGNDQNLTISKMPKLSYSNVPPIINKPIHAMDASFNRTTTSDLSSWIINVLALTVPVQFLLPKFPS